MVLKIFILMLLFFQGVISFSQKKYNHLNNDYQNGASMKYVSQKKTAKALLIGGASAVLLSFIWFSESDESGDIVNDNIGGQGLLFIAGLASMLASIPLFISSNNNKRKNISAGLQDVQYLNRSGLYQNNIQPALSMKISLGR